MLRFRLALALAVLAAALACLAAALPVPGASVSSLDSARLGTPVHVAMFKRKGGGRGSSSSSSSSSSSKGSSSSSRGSSSSSKGSSSSSYSPGRNARTSSSRTIILVNTNTSWWASHSTGVKVGIVIASIVVTLAIAVFVVVLVQRNRSPPRYTIVEPQMAYMNRI
ncbi:hypothetical protein HK105_207246 [Polyrhizophydium stewartii]|uniref:Uncharacterized protein n=1 Tax=Polyrhizophydium stewartii TaxID=2732419 RepID=A0ABR4N166_9FUNG